jgi:hypothetical protein
MLSRGLLTLICALSFGLFACGDDNPTGSDDSIVTIEVDNFLFKATELTDSTDTFSYRWDNSGTLADINQSSTITAGGAMLTVFDADSIQVYAHDLGEDGDFVSDAGAAGKWTVHVAFTDLTGSVTFRLRKKS